MTGRRLRYWAVPLRLPGTAGPVCPSWPAASAAPLLAAAELCAGPPAEAAVTAGLGPASDLLGRSCRVTRLLMAPFCCRQVDMALASLE